MPLDTPNFTFDYQPGAIHYGRDCVADLGAELDALGSTDALVLTGRNVGANRAVMDPIEAGLGDRLAGVFDETTPEKRVETVYDAMDALDDLGADAIVAVGAGSSMDMARFMRLLDADFRDLDQLRDAIAAGGLSAPEESGDLLPIVNVPTTFPGADLSVAAAVTYPTADGGRSETIPVGNSLMPSALFYDPALFETTPMDVLAGSAINGLDKAIEAVYSAHANPITDATAVRSLRYLSDSFPQLRTSDDPAVMDQAVLGIVLGQYGSSIPEAYKINIVHAFGHALRNQFGLQQGIAHAVMIPHVLALVFDQVDGRRDVLAEGLVRGDPDDPAAAVVGAVEEIRDGLGLPSRLRDLDGTSRDGLRDAAVLAHEDPFLDLGPAAFDPTVDEIEAMLEDAW